MLEIKFTVSLSDDTKVFLETLFTGIKCNAQTSKQHTEQMAEKAPVEQHKEPKEQAKPNQQEKQSSLTINDIRAEVMNKVNNNREAIKNKLTEIGIKRVTELTVSQYDEFYEFLKNLE